MEFYWENVDDKNYVIYMDGNIYPLGNLYYCDECELWHFESDFFNYDNDYEDDDIEMIMEFVRLELIEDLKTKIQFMTEELSALGMM